MHSRFAPVWAVAMLSLASPLTAHATVADMLSDRTLARQTLEVGNNRRVELGQALYLLDGSIRSQSTGHITYDRSVHSLTRAATLVPFQAGFRGKLLLESLNSYSKSEGAELPRRIVESKKQESQARAELILSSAMGLEYLVGFQAFSYPAYTKAFQAPALSGDDRYAAFQKLRNYFAITQQAGAMQAGLLYEAPLDETRTVERSNSLESTPTKLDDTVYFPARLNLFARTPLALGHLYAELSLIEASGGGDRNSLQGTLLEDSFRLQLAWSLPLGAKESSLETALIYQSMAYADRQGVDFDTMPLTAVHSKLRWEAALPVYAGLSYLRGHDTQSFSEFNASYQLWGLGAELGTLWNF